MKSIIAVITVGAVLGLMGVCAEFSYLNGVSRQLEAANVSQGFIEPLKAYSSDLQVVYVKNSAHLQPALGVEWTQGGEDNMDWILQ
jgi:hypothetical protein